jgi:Flp pilus assembly pilin Flp
MEIAITKIRAWWQDEGGLETAEWAVLLGAVIVPLAYVILQIALFVARFYELTSWVSTLPFP